MENQNNMRVPARTFQDLIVWQKAHEATLLVYKLTGEFPNEEKYGLTSQFRRASVSIAANIAEGFIKKSDLEKIRFLNISQGSLEECKYYPILAKDLGYGEDKNLNDLYVEVGKMLNAFVTKLKTNAKS
jgi:four helix bundle protein